MSKKNRSEPKTLAGECIDLPKSANDACQLIVNLTRNYETPSASPDDNFIHELRMIALKGLEAESAKVATNLTTKNGLLYWNGKQLGAREADTEARRHGFAYAEQLVVFLTKKGEAKCK